MTVSRIVPNLPVQQTSAAVQFYGDLLGLTPVMDFDWIVTLADPQRPGSQLSLITRDATGSVNPVVSLQVDDVDAAYATAVAAGAEIVHPLTDEEWGVRRFFVRDPAGNVVNVLGHVG